MSEAQAEALAALWRLSRAEAEALRARIALLERAVMRAMAEEATPGAAEAWAELLAAQERATEETAARSARIAALLAMRAA